MNAFKSNFKHLGLFTTAGYPEPDSLLKLLPLLEHYGCTFLEIGIPFSDPMADGPVIQHSSNIALKNGMNLDLIFDQLDQLRHKISIPKVMMGYLNPVLAYGIEPFLKRCQENNIAGIILPDLPFEIYLQKYEHLFRRYDQQAIFIITPGTSNDRVKQLAKHSKNSFLYLTSRNSITGADGGIVEGSERYSEIKQLVGDTPLFIGFGIKTCEDVKNVQSIADGVIIGSAFIQALENKEGEKYLLALQE